MSDSETEQLIKEVERKPFLYDRKHEKYKKVFFKKQAWESIATQIGTFEDSSAAERRWNSLRGKYSTEILRLKADLGNPGQPSKWKYFDQLHFLKDHVQPRTNLNQSYQHQPIVNFRQTPNSNSWSPMDEIPNTTNHSENANSNQEYFKNLLTLFSANNEEDSSQPVENTNGNTLPERRPQVNESPKASKHSNNIATATPVKQQTKRTSNRIFGEYIGEALEELAEEDGLEAQLKIIQIIMEYKKKRIENLNSL